MRLTSVALVVTLISASLLAQASPSSRAGGAEDDIATGLSITDNGTRIIGGEFEHIAYFGEFALYSWGETDVFVAAQNPDGSWLWALRAGGNGEDHLEDLLIVDDQIWIAGSFEDSATMGPEQLVSRGRSDIFLASISLAGHWDQILTAGGERDDSIHALAVSSDDQIFAVGEFGDSASFGDIVVEAPEKGLFLVGLGPENWDSVEVLVGEGANSGATGRDLVVGPDGAITVVGEFYGLILVAGETHRSSENDLFDVLVARWDGSWQWAAVGGSDVIDLASSVALLEGGDVMVSGIYNRGCWCVGGDNSITFGPHQVPSVGVGDVFVARVTTDGEWDWIVGSGGTEWPGEIMVDDDGNGILVGFYGLNATIGSSALPHQGMADMMVSSIDPEGQWLWTLTAGGSGRDQALDLAQDPSGDIIVVGGFEDNLTLDESSLVSSGESDIFIWDLNLVDDEVPSETEGAGQVLVVSDALQIPLSAAMLVLAVIVLVFTTWRVHSQRSSLER